MSQANNCSHVCTGPHGSRYSEQFKLMCHTVCPGCKRPIKYGELNNHRVRECHAESK